MFKQFILAASVAASTLLVGGTVGATAASASTPCAISKSGSVITPQSTSRRCFIRERRGMRCKFCRSRHGEWRREWCSERRRHHDDWDRHRDRWDHDRDRFMTDRNR